MEKGDLFLLIVGTAFCIWMASTVIPELCAIATFVGIGCVFGWRDLLNKI
jgi:hypothetical protein